MKELGQIEFSDEELKGLAIANALANQARVSAKLDPLSDAEYLSARILEVVRGYATEHVRRAENRVLFSALKLATKEDRAAIAATLGVDLEILIPDVVAASADVAEVKH